jgi:uncharacterized protein YjaZ
MGVAIHVLTKSGRLTPFRKSIIKVVHKSVALTKREIPVRKIDILVYDNPRGTIPETGEGGWTENSYLIFISLNPTFKRFDWTINTMLPRVIAHELHHAARWAIQKRDGTLLEALVSEGLATHFEEQITHGSAALWAKAVKGKMLIELTKRAVSEYTSSTYNHRRWFFGKGDPTIPRWTGYSIGYRLVSNYLRAHPKQTAATLLNKPAKSFI